MPSEDALKITVHICPVCLRAEVGKKPDVCQNCGFAPVPPYQTTSGQSEIVSMWIDGKLRFHNDEWPDEINELP